MARIIADRVRELSGTTGTGALTLAGAPAGGWRAWASALAVGDTAPALISNPAASEWEVTEVTLLANGTLERGVPRASSNGGAAVNFGAGTKDVLLTLAAADLGPPLLAAQGFHAADLVALRGAPVIAGGWGPAPWGAQPAMARGVAVQRASGATAVVDGVLTEFALGAPRWADWQGGTNGARALLMGGQRTNLVRNPRALGAVAGAAGTGAMPTHWAGLVASGYTHVLGSGIEAGIPYIDLRCQQSGAGVYTITPETIAATPGQTVAAAINATLVGGSLANVTQLHIAFAFFDGPGGIGGVVSNVLATSLPLTSGPLLPAEYLASAVAPAGAQSVVLRVRARTTGAVDFSIRVGAPRLITGSPLVGTPVFPPGTTLAASTRLADVIPPLAVAGPAAVVLECAVPVLPPAGAQDMLLAQFDGGTDADRLRLRVAAGGTQLVAGRVVGGTATDAAALGTVTPGGRFAVALRHDGAGTLGAAMTGGAVQTLGGGLAGVTSLMIANNRSGTAPLFGLLRQVRVCPRAMTDAELLAAVA